MAEPFTAHRDAALALLNKGEGLSPRAGSFLGQIAVDPTPLTERQGSWLGKLLSSNSLPDFDGRAG